MSKLGIVLGRDLRGGITPPPAMFDFVYGVSSTNDPASVDLTSLTTVSIPSNVSFDFSIGPLVEGQYAVMFVPNENFLVNLQSRLSPDTLVNVLSGYTRTENARTIDGVVNDFYFSGPTSNAADGTTSNLRAFFTEG